MKRKRNETERKRESLVTELTGQGMALVLIHLILEYACPVFNCLKPCTKPTYIIVERLRPLVWAPYFQTFQLRCGLKKHTVYNKWNEKAGHHVSLRLHEIIIPGALWDEIGNRLQKVLVLPIIQFTFEDGSPWYGTEVIRGYTYSFEFDQRFVTVQYEGHSNLDPDGLDIVSFQEFCLHPSLLIGLVRTGHKEPFLLLIYNSSEKRGRLLDLATEIIRFATPRDDRHLLLF